MPLFNVRDHAEFESMGDGISNKRAQPQAHLTLSRLYKIMDNPQGKYLLQAYALDLIQRGLMPSNRRYKYRPLDEWDTTFP